MSENELERLASAVTDELRKAAAGNPAAYLVAARCRGTSVRLGRRPFRSITEALAEAARLRAWIADELVIVDATSGHTVDRLVANG